MTRMTTSISSQAQNIIKWTTDKVSYKAYVPEFTEIKREKIYKKTERKSRKLFKR